MNANISKTLVNVLFTIATVIFILALIASLIMVSAGLGVGEETGLLLEDTVANSSADTISGWGTIFGLFGSMIGGFAAAIILSMGIVCFVGNIIVYAPAMIARIVIRKPSKNKIIAYWILMAIWLVLIIACGGSIFSIFFSVSFA